MLGVRVQGFGRGMMALGVQLGSEVFPLFLSDLL